MRCNPTRERQFVWLAVLSILMFAAFGSPASGATVSFQSPAATIEARVSGDSIEFWIVAIAEPIGALEFTIDGLPELDGECEVTSGFGACGDGRGDLLVVAVNPTGFTADTQLAKAKVDATIDDALVAINVVQATDIAGQAVSTGTNLAVSEASQSSVPTALFIGVALLAIAVLIAGWRIVGTSRHNKAQEEA